MGVIMKQAFLSGLLNWAFVFLFRYLSFLQSPNSLKVLPATELKNKKCFETDISYTYLTICNSEEIPDNNSFFSHLNEFYLFCFQILTKVFNCSSAFRTNICCSVQYSREQ